MLSEEESNRLQEIQRVIELTSGLVSVKRLASTLEESNAVLDGKVIVVPLSALNTILDVANTEGVSMILQRMDLERNEARLVIHGNSIETANDLIIEIESVTEIDYVKKPANSRCQ
jgi:hypothetical protein